MCKTVRICSLLLYLNNEGADQPAHPMCSLVDAFVAHYVDSIIMILAKSKISRVVLASVAEQASLSPTRFKPRRQVFS